MAEATVEPYNISSYTDRKKYKNEPDQRLIINIVPKNTFFLNWEQTA